MHPAPSLIVFSTLSGAGYGLLFLLGAATLARLVPGGWAPALGVGLALLLITVGLLSSTRHLEHPERAWRAISQWRSSWLSREGLAALLTYLPASALALGLVLEPGADKLWVRTAGALAACGAAVTVWCTGMIYRSLKPVRGWDQPLTPWLYIGHALFGGALLLHLVVLAGRLDLASGAGWLALALLAIAWITNLVWRRHIAAGDWPAVGEATGLAKGRQVRMVEPPHTQSNYLLDEMAYRVGRKHARKLRMVATAGLLLAGALTAIALAVSGPVAIAAATFAVLAGLAATAVGRWLFFAEATHTVALYYGIEDVPEAKQSRRRA